MTDFSLFRSRLAEACAARKTTITKVARIVGISPRRAMEIEYSGVRVLDIERLTQIADRLEVSVDWLLGRSDKMGVDK